MTLATSMYVVAMPPPLVCRSPRRVYARTESPATVDQRTTPTDRESVIDAIADDVAEAIVEELLRRGSMRAGDDRKWPRER
jgi:hypothetical protein